ncbi:MAG: type II secretion system F family protein [Loktanella sp.]|nr:type II secretion system F family protein [Loktanella sp.]
MWIEVIIFAAILCSTTGPGLVAVLLIDRRRQQRKARLMRAVQSGPLPQRQPNRVPAITKPRKTKRTRPGLITALDARLALAGLSVGAMEFLLLTGFLALALATMAHFLFSLPVLVALSSGTLAAGAGSSLWLRAAHTRRLTEIVAHLPEALDAFARGLKAGRPVADALGLVIESTPAPLSDELGRARDMLSVGHDLAETLRRLAERVAVPEVRFFSVATQLQAETGGNLVETIENLADQLRQRRAMRKKIRALSAEAKASALILSILPFAVAALLLVINPPYLMPLVADPRGLSMTGLGLISLTTGIIVLSRMGRLDV